MSTWEYFRNAAMFAAALLFLIEPAFGLDRVEVKRGDAKSDKPLSGRLFVFFSSSDRGEPKNGPNWFRPEPFFGQDVENFKLDETRVIDATVDSFPEPIDRLPGGTYRVQAVLHQDLDCPFPGSGVGNPYSRVETIEVKPGAGTLQLLLDQIVEEPKFAETAWRKEIVVRSELLSKFQRREVIERAAVILPADYDEHPERRYPVIYSIPGFGGSHRDALRLDTPPPVDESGVAFIRVMLSGRCLWGHHVFANSLTNGPRGDALVQELIPEIDRRFRTVAASTGRFVTGHSSGGWSSLWLQVSYPDTFGGVWSTGPDPVDFRDYQQVNLYASPPQNMYRDAKGDRLPIARQQGKPVLWYDDFTRMDDVLKRGGQLRSFEAVFSALDERGEPKKMYDRKSGEVQPAVVEAWKTYDIRLKLENWPTLEPKLRGKLHIVMGDIDTFYLDGAVKQLAATLKSLGSDAQVEIVPDADHSSVLTPALRQRMRQEMAAQYLKHHPMK